MESSTLVAVLGDRADTPEVISVLNQLDAPSPKLKRGDTNAYVDIPKAGLYLVFTDEAFFTKAKNLGLGEGALLLTNVTFNSNAVANYSTYREDLPFGLSFSDSRETSRSKLGVPELSIDRRRMDRWLINDKWVFAVYAEDMNSIQRMSVQLPDQN